jgi:short-subunit dehydrogenase
VKQLLKNQLLEDQRIILTGASGGIGSEIAKQLIQYHCKIGLVGRSEQKLQQLAKELEIQGADKGSIHVIACDITNLTGQKSIIDEMKRVFLGHDMLINTAGLMDFIDFSQQSDERIDSIIKTNVVAPMQLSKKALSFMLKQNKGHIVNIGSIFGSIGFAWFTSYSTSKFALRGFSESLRRELADTAIKVSYIAPRAVKTSLNSSAVYKMAEAVKMNMDPPEVVAMQIVQAIINQQKDTFLGFPEKLFVRINAIFPSLVDMATSSQNRLSKKFLK